MTRKKKRINTSKKGSRHELEFRHLLEPYGEVIVDRICSKGPYDFRFKPTFDIAKAVQIGRLLAGSGVDAAVIEAMLDAEQWYIQVKSNSVGDARRKFKAWTPAIFGPGLKVVAVRYDGSRQKPVRWTVEVTE